MSFDELDVTGWDDVGDEPAGSKQGKRWLAEPHPTERRRWLFKPNVPGKAYRGDDWSEKLAGEVAKLLGLPCATTELAIREEGFGVISRDVAGARSLTMGNEVLAGRVPGSGRGARTRIPGYTPEAVLGALDALDVGPPPGSPDGISASGTFAGYLILDALVANMDRHDENWGLLLAPNRTPLLAPTFDHASSLGFQLSDDERQDRLRTSDRGRTVEAYAARGRSRHFEGRVTLVELAGRGCRLSGTAAHWRAALDATPIQRLADLADAIPARRMSPSARRFAGRLMAVNRGRLLDELTHA